MACRRARMYRLCGRAGGCARGIGCRRVCFRVWPSARRTLILLRVLGRGTRRPAPGRCLSCLGARRTVTRRCGRTGCVLRDCGPFRITRNRLPSRRSSDISVPGRPGLSRQGLGIALARGAVWRNARLARSCHTRPDSLFSRTGVWIAAGHCCDRVSGSSTCLASRKPRSERQAAIGLARRRGLMRGRIAWPGARIGRTAVGIQCLRPERRGKRHDGCRKLRQNRSRRANGKCVRQCAHRISAAGHVRGGNLYAAFRMGQPARRRRLDLLPERKAGRQRPLAEAGRDAAIPARPATDMAGRCRGARRGTSLKCIQTCRRGLPPLGSSARAPVVPGVGRIPVWRGLAGLPRLCGRVRNGCRARQRQFRAAVGCPRRRTARAVLSGFRCRTLPGGGGQPRFTGRWISGIRGGHFPRIGQELPPQPLGKVAGQQRPVGGRRVRTEIDRDRAGPDRLRRLGRNGIAGRFDGAKQLGPQ